MIKLVRYDNARRSMSARNAQRQIQQNVECIIPEYTAMHVIMIDDAGNETQQTSAEYPGYRKGGCPG